MNTRAALENAITAIALTTPQPARTTSGPRTTERRLPINTGKLKAATHLHRTLESWAALIRDEKPATYTGGTSTIEVIVWMIQHAEWLDTHEAANDCHNEITTAAAELIRTIDTADDRVFVGTHAGQPIYARPGQKTVRLPDGTEQRVDTLRNHLRRQTLEATGTAHEVATILNTVFGMNTTAQRIAACYGKDKQARAQGRLRPLEGLDAIGMDGNKPIFLVDEVITRLAATQRAKDSTR